MRLAISNKISGLIDRIKSFESNVESITDTTMDEELPNLIRSQLADGENGDGKDIQIGYSNMWANERSKKGLQTDYVDLNFSGTFYKSLYTEEVGNSYFVDSLVHYASDLFDRYDNITGIQDGSRKLLINKLKMNLIKNF